MKKGFSTIMSAQFFSSLADNALFVAAVELLRTPAPRPGSARRWCRCSRCSTWCWRPSSAPLPTPCPRARSCSSRNAIKVVGCLMMLFGAHPLLAYAIVGLGAAAYSPAKYGILTELLPPSQLVKANGWIEGLTIASIILGVLLGGQLVGRHVVGPAAGAGPALRRHRHRHAPEAAIAAIVLLYVVAALFNPVHPAHRGTAAADAAPAGPGARLLALQRAAVARQAGPDLAGHDHAVLGRGRQPALHRAGLGRGGAGLRHDAGLALVGVVAIGTAVGAVVAAMACGWTGHRRDPAGHRHGRAGDRA
jgi:MFS transporter, LPLT family, lysophospholipid transporter